MRALTTSNFKSTWDKLNAKWKFFYIFGFCPFPQIVAIIIEGRNDNRSGKRGYRKLETNVEEAMPAMKNTHSTYVY